MKTVFKCFFSFVFLLILSLWLFGYGYIFRGLWSTYFRFEKSAQVDDARFFFNDTIAKSFHPFVWPKSINYNKKNLSVKLKKTLEEYKTHSFLVVHKDSLVFEEYWKNWSVSNNKSNSFSMAKSIVSLVSGLAVDDGFLSGFNQPIKSVFPEMSFYTGGKEVTLGDLLNMSAGLEWNENYFNPFNITARSYMTKDLKNLTLSLSFDSEAGVNYVYQSGATQLATLMLDRVLKEKGEGGFSEYTQKKLWNNIGAEEDAFWSLDDKNGDVKGFCCFHSNAKDFAKIGRLFLNNGLVNDSVVILKKWYFDRVFNGGLVDYYSYGWWKGTSLGVPIYYMRGFLGQFVVVVPQYDLIIVRLGRKNLRNRNNPDLPTKPFEIYVSEVLKDFI